MDLDRLRRETQQEHLATEQAMPVMAPGLTPELYIKVLLNLHQLVCGWETWTTHHAPADLTGMVQERQRGHLIEQDLLSLGAAIPQQIAPFPAEDIPGLRVGAPEFCPSFLGAMYVMEGSTLGGQHIARHLEAVFDQHPCTCNAYFRGYGHETGALWQAFREVMLALPAEDEVHAIAAAKAMFRVVRRGLAG